MNFLHCSTQAWFPFTTSARNFLQTQKFFNFHSLHFFRPRARGIRYFLTFLTFTYLFADACSKMVNGNQARTQKW